MDVALDLELWGRQRTLDECLQAKFEAADHAVAVTNARLPGPAISPTWLDGTGGGF